MFRGGMERWNTPNGGVSPHIERCCARLPPSHRDGPCWTGRPPLPRLKRAAIREPKLGCSREGGDSWRRREGGNMKAVAAKLLDFLTAAPQFVIPIYQRTYSWTERECLQLWNDMLRVGGDDNVPAHFIGSIVYVKEGLYQVTIQPPLLVIDGQQRLTTVMNRKLDRASGTRRRRRPAAPTASRRLLAARQGFQPLTPRSPKMRSSFMPCICDMARSKTAVPPSHSGTASSS
jgi:hypothetical protein